MLQRFYEWVKNLFNREFHEKSRDTSIAKVDEVKAEIETSREKFVEELVRWETSMRRRR